ncbi:MAG TPA: DUF192 domain-containing protein [Candidatus Saccharimonadales bacterium]|nr:DUF192 domain-containing protein [Candidatus Saccharimonadales bacterium]
MTKQRLKRFNRLLIASAFLLIVLIGFVVLAQRPSRLVLANAIFTYELASTPSKQLQGLSGRSSLPLDHAMLFVFQAAGQDCFWMKDMHFPLDIIWLNDQKQAVYIKENATPQSYPEQFCPDKLARYVVEVNAGVAKGAGLKLGDTVRF